MPLTLNTYQTDYSIKISTILQTSKYEKHLYLHPSTLTKDLFIPKATKSLKKRPPTDRLNTFYID